VPNVLITFGRDGPPGAADFCGAEQPRHQGIVHHVEEMIGSRPAVVPLQVEPAGRGVGVPCEHPRPAGSVVSGGVRNVHRRRRARSVK
jgi:hypothetical protein